MLYCDFSYGTGAGEENTKIKGRKQLGSVHTSILFSSFLHTEVFAVILWVNVVTIWLFQPLDAHFL